MPRGLLSNRFQIFCDGKLLESQSKILSYLPTPIGLDRRSPENRLCRFGPDPGMPDRLRHDTRKRICPVKQSLRNMEDIRLEVRGDRLEKAQISGNPEHV